MPLRGEESFGLGKRGYFHVLERAHEGSRPPSPGSCTTTPTLSADDASLDGIPAKGYYERYFKEECRLGMGAEGSVYLATHIIGGNTLGKLLAMPVILMGRNICGQENRCWDEQSLFSKDVKGGQTTRGIATSEHHTVPSFMD